MEGISDISIIGIDELRPPVIRKEPYIDLYFKLSRQAPADWCRDFNALLSHHPASPKIKEKEGYFIESWVRKPDEIVELFDMLKQAVADCTQQYIERIESARHEANAEGATSLEEDGEQGRLNRIIASLDFAKPLNSA
jgi:hypothetical protein